MKGAGKYLQVLVGLVVGVGLAWFATMNVNWDRVGQVLKDADYRWLAGSVLVLFLHYGVKAWRWRILLDHKAAVPYGLVFRTMAVGFLMNNLIPARLGELSSRPYLLAANAPKVPFSFALATVLGAKVLDLLIVGSLLLVSAAFYTIPDDWTGTAMWVVGGAAFLGVIGGIAAFKGSGEAFEIRMRGLFSWFLSPAAAGKLSAQMTRFSEGMAVLGDVRTFIKSLSVTLFSFVVLWAAIACTAKALHLSLGLTDGIMVLALMGVGFALPAPPTYAGNIHYFVTRAVVLTGLGGEDVGFSLGVLVHAVEVVVMCGQGLVSLPGLKWKAEDDPSTAAETESDSESD